MNWDYIINNLLPILSEGFVMSLKIFCLTLLFAIPLGVLVALGRMSRFKPLSWLMRAYILVMRGTPLLLQLMVVCYGPYYIFEISYDRFLAAIIAFVLNYAAYFAEIFRGGILSIPQGQWEASETLGFTKIQTFFRVILPQVFKRILPASSNEVITLVKDTALAQVIGVIELFSLAKKQASNKVNVMPLFVAGIYYLLFNWLLSFFFGMMERKLDYYK